MMLATLAHTMRADLRERLRRPAFLVVVALTALAGFAFAPPTDAGYTVIDLGGYRGVYNGAWVGAMLTMLLTQFVGLFGFFYVRGSIAFDIDSGVGQILGATPLRRPAYLIGKWLSGWATLALLTGIVGLMGVLLLLARGESGDPDLAGLLLPLLVIALPTMGLIAGIATLFDTLRPLRGAAGSIIYFVLFLGALGAGAFSVADPSGSGALAPSIIAACSALYGANCGEQLAVGLVFREGVAQTFVWPGMVWTTAVVIGQWFWALIGFGLVLAGTALFDGFVTRKAPATPVNDTVEPALRAVVLPPAPEPATLSPVRPAQHTFGRVFLAELRLMFKGRAWWWYAGALGFIAATLLNDSAAVAQFILPLAWLWPLLLLSELGIRERRFAVAPLLQSAPQALRRQLPAIWLAGAVMFLLLGSGAAISLSLAGNILAILGITITALLIPALALALGRWSGSPRLFEIIYLVLWYGALNGIPAVMPATADLSQIMLRAAITVALLVVAGLGRRR